MKKATQSPLRLRVALLAAASLGIVSLAFAFPDIGVTDPRNDPYIRIGPFHMLPLIASTVAALVVALAVPVFLRSNLARRLLIRVLIAAACILLMVLLLITVPTFFNGFVPIDGPVHGIGQSVVLYGLLLIATLLVAHTLRQPGVTKYFLDGP